MGSIHAAKQTQTLAHLSFNKALMASQLGSDPTQAYFLVGVLKASGAPDDDVEALRRELLHTYADQLAGLAPMNAGTVADAIALGRARGDVLDATFVSRWQSAYNQGLEIRWADGDTTTPYFALLYRGMRPVAPGIWAEESSTGKTYLRLGLRLFNKTAIPVPIHNPDIVWGAEPGSGHGGLEFACSWDQPEAPHAGAKRDEVLLLEPGGISRAIVCETPPTGASWKEKLLGAPGAPQPSGRMPRLVSHELDNSQRQLFLERALDELATQSKDWRLRMQAAQQEVGRQWLPAKLPLQAPVAQKWAIRPYAGWAEAGKKLQWFLGASLMTLALFAGGRVLLRSGVPARAVSIGTLLVGGGLMFAGLKDSGGGTGYSSPFYVGLALYTAIVGPMMFGVLALHGLHRVLDDEGVSWWRTVVRGWTHLLDLRSSASRADFWGFFAHCVWWWALARMCLTPLDIWLSSLLLLALLTLAVRRFRSLAPSELLALVITLVALVLLTLLPPH